MTWNPHDPTKNYTDWKYHAEKYGNTGSFGNSTHNRNLNIAGAGGSNALRSSSCRDGGVTLRPARAVFNGVTDPSAFGDFINGLVCAAFGAGLIYAGTLSLGNKQYPWIALALILFGACSILAGIKPICVGFWGALRAMFGLAGIVMVISALFLYITPYSKLEEYWKEITKTDKVAYTPHLHDGSPTDSANAPQADQPVTVPASVAASPPPPPARSPTASTELPSQFGVQTNVNSEETVAPAKGARGNGKRRHVARHQRDVAKPECVTSGADTFCP